MTTATTREVKSFKDVPSMWYGFAGAESWDNGDQPVFCEIGQPESVGYNDACQWLLIADRNGCGVYGDEEKDAFGGMLINIPFPTQKAAIAFLTGLPDDFKPEDYEAKAY